MKPSKELKDACKASHLDDLVSSLKVHLRIEEKAYVAWIEDQQGRFMRVCSEDTPSRTRRKAISIITDLNRGCQHTRRPKIEKQVEAQGAPATVPTPAQAPVSKAVEEAAPVPGCS